MNLIVTFDGVPISMADSIEEVFEPANGEPVWAAMITEEEKGEEVTIVVAVPHFSEHTITISSIAEVVNIITILLAYIAILVVVGLMIIAPIIHIDRKER